MDKVTKAAQALEDMKEAREALEKIDLDGKLNAMAKIEGWDVEIAEEVKAKKPTPKVKLTRRSRVEDAIQAETLCRMHWGLDNKDYTPTQHQLFAAKLSMLATFDGQTWELPKIMELNEDFFTHMFLKLLRYTG